MKKNVLFGLALVCSAFLSNVMAAEVKKDSAVYTPRGANGELTLTSKWLYSNKLNNYNVAADLIAPAATARGMAVKDGKMLFIDRTNKQIVVVNGTTGAKETPIALNQTMFTYQGRNKANTADSTYTAGLWGYQDIKVDNAGNVLVGNIITSNSGRFQVWKVDMATGNGTIVIDQANLATLYPAATTMRFDAFGVWGDVTSNAVIMAANASAMEVYKWTITNGVASAPSLIELDNSATTGADLAGLTNLGSAPQVFPLDDNYFYVDGNATFPVLCDKEGNVIDGFKSKLANLKDSVTVPGTTWTMVQGQNGVKEFEIGGKYFIVMAASNTDKTPPSAFRLFQFADAGKAFSGLTCLWTFPQAGMGTMSNSYRTAMPCVEVSGNVARIYVYIGENGYGMYELKVSQTGIDELVNNNAVQVTIDGRTMNLSETVASVKVYSLAGQLISRNANVSSVSVENSGIYIVKALTVNGETAIHKVVVK